MEHYYYKKYQYLRYDYMDTGGLHIMFSIPPSMLSKQYKNILHRKPKTFFDCGAALGVIVQMAIKDGMDARGIDIRKYPEQRYPIGVKEPGISFLIETTELQNLSDSGRLEIKSILDCEPIFADIAYCNGTLTYFDTETLPTVLSKFQNVGMLCAIHNTTEDINAAAQMNQTLLSPDKPRNIQSNKWWIETFSKNGFNATFNKVLGAFIAIPKQK